jgi:inosine-uridine nucleoside N-ribohydrolase
MPEPAPISVILDTDLGYDIDDTWALALLLRCPELEPRLILSDSLNTTYSASLIAKLLQSAGRTDVPVGVGLRQSDDLGKQLPWLGDYKLDSYPGTVHGEGVDALISTIMDSSDQITLVCTGPLPNIAAALEREPRIAQRARFVGMHGSIRFGLGGSPTPIREYNVSAFPRACQAVFKAPWDITITPLDTCGLVTLKGDEYRQVRGSDDPLVRALIENYRVWAEGWGQPALFSERSSTLFDTVAVYLAFSHDLLNLEQLPVRVSDDGFTVIDESARPITCATSWRDLPAFERFLAARVAPGRNPQV